MAAETVEQLLAKYDDLARIAGDLDDLGRQISQVRAYQRESFNWDQFRAKLDDQKDAIREKRFRLAFAGGFSVGKSYLINSFLGKPGLLPSYNKPTTGVVCVLRKGRRPYMEVTYWSRTESDEMQRFYLNELGIPRSVPIEEGPAAADELRSSLEANKRHIVDDYRAFRAAHERYANKLGTTEEVEVRDVKPEHRAAPSVADYPHLNFILKVDSSEGEPNQDLLRSIKQVVLYVDSPYLTETVEVVDLPGAGATDPIDGFIQRYFLRRTDGVVVTTRATDPFGEEEQTVVEILRENHGALSGRIFIALTMFDRLAGPELEPERLDKEYKSLRRKLSEKMSLGDAPFFFVSPFISLLAELDAHEVPLSDNDRASLERAREWKAPDTTNPKLDELLAIYTRDGGMGEVRKVLLEQFRSSMVRLKVQQIARALQHLSGMLDSTYRKRWTSAQRDQAKEGARRFTYAIKYLSGCKDNFVKRSQRFRREVVQKQDFDEVFKQVLAKVDQRIQLYMDRCSEESLRHEYDGLGGGRDPVELLNRFRETSEAAILEDFNELIWDRMPRPSFETLDQDFDLEEEPEARDVPELPSAEKGLLRRHVRDQFYEGIKRDELMSLVSSLLPNNPEERQIFSRVFDELDLALEITTRNFVMREALELNDSKELDDLSRGAAEFPDWAKRYAKDYAKAFQKRLERYCRNLQSYLWNLYFKHLEDAESRIGEFLGSDELMGLVTVHLDDIEIPSQTGRLGSPAKLLEHFERWKTIDAAITTLEREVAS